MVRLNVVTGPTGIIGIVAIVFPHRMLFGNAYETAFPKNET
jgi:hypothetical protein